ncbi:MAG TPA: Gfo/Idh/MocA family oxidoreductase [Bacillota bacterium]|nr:Gfo/Idh/MocA family oxidoreductase [Bacillota bacterium]
MDINIGIIGSGQIIYQGLVMPVMQTKVATVYGIASRNLEKAQSCAVKCKIPHVFATFDELLGCPEINLVYVALPNHLHSEMIIKAAEQGKHILVEKPVCLSTEEFGAICAACEKNQVHLLEGIMVQHHPWQRYLQQFITEGSLGRLQQVVTKISFIPQYDLNCNYRAYPEYGGGCFFDLGPYWVQFIQSILGLEVNSLEGRSDFSGSHQADLSFQAKLFFPREIEASMLASFERPYEASHELVFEKGIVKVDNFFKPNMGRHKLTLWIENQELGQNEAIKFPPQNYFINQLEFLVEVIKGTARNIDIRDSGERVRMMDLIYRDAKRNHETQ